MSVQWLSDAVKAPDPLSEHSALERQRHLTKPPGSLGQLEQLAVRFAGLQRTSVPRLERITVRVFAADHGVAAQGVSAFPQTVTAQMVANFCRGGAAICVLSKSLDADFKVVNLGCIGEISEHPILINQPIAPATLDFTQAPAMSRTQLALALNTGRAQIGPADVFIGGEMGIGNTTAAAALLAALFDLPAAAITGRGTGIDDRALAKKLRVIERALEFHRAKRGQPLALLQALGGFEIAALVGAYIACAQRGVPVLVDGFISTAAAAMALAIEPEISPWLIYSHLSDEAGHRLALEQLGAEPLLSLGMRLGEGTGAAMAAGLVRDALALHNGMATFAEAGVASAD